MSARHLLTTLAVSATAAGAAVHAASTPPATVQFNRDIRPILAEACFHCHGPDPGTRKASLRLDTEQGFFAARDGGDSTVVKGQPGKSSLYQRIITADVDDVMPPPESHKDLKPEQKELIKKWIEQGASWQPHWSLVKPERPALPTVPGAKTEAKNPIDRFVEARLATAGLTPAPEADKHTLMRRVTLDLTGLPPSPEEVDAFVSDTRPDAYEKLVDRLLDSKRYGEHRARYWLDAARYGDTHGLHFDNYREMWLYRDWVVNAFNKNEPFDAFTVEQIAGDLLPNRTDDQLIATGFQRCNITTNEGGTIDEENLALYAADRVQTLGWVYMGFTVNCAQCHDHKFDPITTKDYYALAAFFRNTTQGAKDLNQKDSGPILVVPSGKDKTRWTALPKEIEVASAARTERKKVARAEFDQWLASAKPDTLDKDVPSDGIVAHVPLNEGVGNEVQAICGPPRTIKATGEISWAPDGKLGPAPVLKSGSTFVLGDEGDFEQKQSFSYGAWIKAGRNGVYGGIIARMDEKGQYRGWDLFQADRGLAVHIVSDWPEDALKVSTRNAVLKPGTWQHVFVTYNGSGKANGIKMYVDGVEQKLNTENATLKPTSSIRTQTPLRIGQRSDVQTFEGGSVQDARVYARALSPEEVKRISEMGPLRAILAAASDKRTPQQRNALYDHYLITRDESYKKLNKSVVDLEKEKTDIKARSPITHVQEEVMNVKPMTPILMRGEYDKKGDVVEAGTPAALGPAMPTDAPQNRLGLAKWLVDPNNPLTARVTMNRFWQELFGQGLVKTSEDFGIMGSAPSHPELLDWLSVEFRESGWDMKHMFKLMLTSATYKQAALATPEKLEKDRDNALLSRGPRFRMDAEMVRDYALAASGTLSPTMGGPGTRPYQPENIWEIVGLAGGNTRNYVQDTGEGLYRRTLYNFWKRMAPSPNMEAFNAPSRETSCVRRERTNTPLQALVTMNDPQFVEAARNLAQHAMQYGKGDSAKAVGYVANQLLCRPLKPEENAIVQASLTDLLAHYRSKPEDASALIGVGATKADSFLDPAQLAAWTMLCNQIMNLDEVLNK
ncbi:DUF1553 domain-containing protein [Roseimicrobium sp. ORNL1]|uniref:DUF1553 domain-containing protein n=1 Tax=Roseimicrobium sp. ORNL1 TaxID=2711231 RepID=UPI0013E12261|nr:DUF1553 domain-containing protein [Roseimicrobium sp. ORNL1]QIF03987.1 DUF1553 domain-containing protein [Roseimicrobium sp. ORNL1]